MVDFEIVEKSKYLAEKRAVFEKELSLETKNINSSYNKLVDEQSSKIRALVEPRGNIFYRFLAIAGILIFFLALAALFGGNDFFGGPVWTFLGLIFVLCAVIHLIGVANYKLRCAAVNRNKNSLNSRRQAELQAAEANAESKFIHEEERFNAEVMRDFTILSADRTYDNLIKDLADEFSSRIQHTDRFDYIKVFTADLIFSVEDDAIVFYLNKDFSGELNRYELYKHHYGNLGCFELRVAMAVILGRAVRSEILRKYPRDPNGSPHAGIPDVTVTRCDNRVILSYKADNPYYIEPHLPMSSIRH